MLWNPMGESRNIYTLGATHPPVQWLPGVKLTIHHSLVPRLRMSGAILPLT
jgi:hypothetical protein